MPNPKGESKKIDYRTVIREAVGSLHDDNWAERTQPNNGTQLTPGMLNVSDEFASEYAESI